MCAPNAPLIRLLLPPPLPPSSSPADFGPLALSGLLVALVPALLMNVAIVGLNQLYDIEVRERRMKLTE